MHDPDTLIFDFPPYSFHKWMDNHPRLKKWIPKFIYNTALFSVWHHDPCTDGTDDSCGWFKRARHGSKEDLEKVIRRFEMDWDKTFTPDGTDRKYNRGYFTPLGEPNMSVHGIVLNLFVDAATSMMGREKGWTFCKNNLFEILIFAENPVDSLNDSILRTFEKMCGEPYSKERRDERLRKMASCIYAWILRKKTPWYRHPRFHVHHWRISSHLWYKIQRRFFLRCCKCGQHFKFNECPISDWAGKRIWHDRCDDSGVKCGGPKS